MNEHDLGAQWRSIVQARERFFDAQRPFAGLLREERIRILHDALRRPGDRETALAIVELLTGDEQVEFVDDLVTLVSFDDRSGYRCAAILRSIAQPEVVERIERQVSRLLFNEADYFAYLRLGGLLRGLGSPMLQSVIERAAASSDPDIRDTVEFLLRDEPRWVL